MSTWASVQALAAAGSGAVARASGLALSLVAVAALTFLFVGWVIVSGPRTRRLRMLLAEVFRRAAKPPVESRFVTGAEPGRPAHTSTDGGTAR
jgi:hypothetical protein